MEQQSTKIRFYAVRTFNEKFNASFDFLKQNWKPLVKYITYLILPVCIIQMFFTMRFMNGYMGLFQTLMGSMGDMDSLSAFNEIDWISYSMLMICNIIGTTFVTSTIYSIIQIYNERENGIQNLTFTELKPYLLKNIGRYLVSFFMIFIFLIIFMVIAVFLGVATPFTAILTIPAFFAMCIAISLFIPVYMFENVNVFSAFTKSITMGFATWGGIFVISLVMLLIGSILQGVMSMPYSAMVGVQTIFSLSDTTEVSPSGFNAISYILGVISIYGSLLGSMFFIIGMAYQYSHAAEKMNSVSVVEDIDNFENF